MISSDDFLLQGSSQLSCLQTVQSLPTLRAVCLVGDSHLSEGEGDWLGGKKKENKRRGGSESEVLRVELFGSVSCVLKKQQKKNPTLSQGQNCYPVCLMSYFILQQQDRISFYPFFPRPLTVFFLTATFEHIHRNRHLIANRICGWGCIHHEGGLSPISQKPSGPCTVFECWWM